MKKIYATLETGFCGAFYEGWFKFEDDVTEEEIDREIEEWAEEIKADMCIEWQEEEEEEEK